MKIIISPSKTQDFTRGMDKRITNPLFKEKSDKIVERIQGFSKPELSDRLNVKGNLLQETYDNYQDYKNSESTAAILAYTGQLFKGLDIENYGEKEYEFLDKHLYILSALYGILKPFDKINSYRLDMKCKVFDNQTLYSYWGEDITNLFQKDELILNLASKEFSKLIKRPMITIEFKEKSKEGKYKTIGTYAKQARGKMLNYIIKNKIKDIESLKKFNEDSYTLNKELSREDVLVFTR
ncbi:YaaA family protein [Clostridium sp. D2Q-11]|uniref:UPF0246 protein GOQ27_08705 n=1 Tax=Anaeromonas frigoriresistens TaxID=2683708 RepID=A0A942UX47_9FIRM|nr:YaaA family protein [Anaeromonas frigoriresistens]MBS4538541.1 YaaA family protein [Anaeromonas frigoriresistens]